MHNRLMHETSPYLLQHAYNPVGWWPWCEEVWAKAAAENKPVFLSIGYSTCHWCHRMAHDVFEDHEVGALLAQHFLCVKVDKEERPDIDGVYMRACQALTGSGGWPTSLFLTPDKLPFFAGTYFPKPAFMRLVDALGLKWQTEREAILQTGQKLADALRREGFKRLSRADAPASRALSQLKKSFDPEWGGFSPAPKFPTPHVLLFLLATEPDMAYATLDHMARGGIFDHIGHGFCRYSTDRQWLMPHFEKMLCDNALLAIAYLRAWQKSGNPRYRRVAEQTLAYMEAELKTEDPVFCAAQDADADGQEGGYYLLCEAEIQDLLGKTDGAMFARAFGLAGGDPREPRVPNLIGLPDPPEPVLRLLPRVQAYRRARARLHTDHKILTAWNAMAIWAFADAGRMLGEERYLDTARRGIAYLNEHLFSDGVLYTSITKGQLGTPGFLDDYAYLALADLALHEATGEERYLTMALWLAQLTADSFWDADGGGFFFSGTENEELFLRPKEIYDGAVPSGNAVMAMVLSKLAALTDNEKIARLSTAQQDFMNKRTWDDAAGHTFYLLSVVSKWE